MSYKKSKDYWSGLEKYNLSGKKYILEKYTPPVTMPFNDWQQYVASGNNVLSGSGGIIPSGTVQTAFGGGGTVYRGHVRSGYGVS